MAVEGGRDIASAINTLLLLPFSLKIATKDFHPIDHVSFASSHDPPNNKPFESFTQISNPADKSQQHSIPIWPRHCVQGTKGADLIPELNTSELDAIVEKGRDKRLEMFSGFADVFGNKSSEATSLDLAALLKSKDISHVYTVGIAGDFCVKCTALDAKKEGFEVYAIEEAIKSVNPAASGWGAARREMQDAGIRVISANGPEIAKVKNQY